MLISVKHRFGRHAALVGAGLLALTACAGGDDGAAEGDQATDGAAEDGGQDEQVTIRVATAVDLYSGYMPVIAHEELGTFEDEDFNVEVISATTPTIGQVLAGGEADVALAGGPALVSHSEAGVPVQFTAMILGPWDNYVIVSDEGEYAGASSMEELEGANFGITGEGSPGNYLLYRYSEELGNDYQETALGDFGSLFGALASGSVDATIWAADQAYVTEQEGVATNFHLPDPHPNIMQALGVTDEFLDEHTDVVKDFLEAYFAKVEELQENPEDFVDVMVEWGNDRDVAERLAEDHLMELSTDGVPSEEQLNGMARAVPFMSGEPEADPPSIDYTPWPEL